jgi:hypothetical protein
VVENCWQKWEKGKNFSRFSGLQLKEGGSHLCGPSFGFFNRRTFNICGPSFLISLFALVPFERLHCVCRFHSSLFSGVFAE